MDADGHPQSGGGSSNVEVTVFFHRPLVASDEQDFTAASPEPTAYKTPFTVEVQRHQTLCKKGGFMFDSYFGRWYRIVKVTNDTGIQLSVFVDQSRPLDRRAGEPRTSRPF